MCGKFSQVLAWDGLTLFADLAAADGASEAVTPMRFATIIRLGRDGKREAVRMRWGLAAPHAKDPNRSLHIHARAESIDEKPTFRDAFCHRRALVVVNHFNEGKELSPTKTEQYVVTPNDKQPIAIAVVWERWAEPRGGVLESFAMVTVAANALIGTITDRMPAVIAPEAWGKWLGEEPASIAELKALLVPFHGDWSMRKAEKAPPPAKPADIRQPSLF
jgi:putative SOS response-associated peptidase YedK